MPSLVLMSSSHYITGVFALFVESFICCLITLTVHSLTIWEIYHGYILIMTSSTYKTNTTKRHGTRFWYLTLF